MDLITIVYLSLSTVSIVIALAAIAFSNLSEKRVVEDVEKHAKDILDRFEADARQFEERMTFFMKEMNDLTDRVEAIAISAKEEIRESVRSVVEKDRPRGGEDAPGR